MRTAVFASLLFALSSGIAGAKPGPNTALRVGIASDWIAGAALGDRGCCPPRWHLTGKVTMPTPGWKLTVDKIERPDEFSRVLYVTGTPSRVGTVAQVLTPTKVDFAVGGFRKGATLVEIRYRPAKNVPYARVDAFVVNGS